MKINGREDVWMQQMALKCKWMMNIHAISSLLPSNTKCSNSVLVGIRDSEHKFSTERVYFIVIVISTCLRFMVVDWKTAT